MAPKFTLHGYVMLTSAFVEISMDAKSSSDGSEKGEYFKHADLPSPIDQLKPEASIRPLFRVSLASGTHYRWKNISPFGNEEVPETVARALFKQTFVTDFVLASVQEFASSLGYTLSDGLWSFTDNSTAAQT